MSTVDWSAIRSRYENGNMSLSAMERAYGVSRQAIKKRATKEQWFAPERAELVTPQLPVTGTSNHQGVIRRDLNAVQRLALALPLRAKKLTYEEIAQQCGYANAGAARNAIMRELERVVVENVEELRREESMILDKLHESFWDRAIDNEHKHPLSEDQHADASLILKISQARRELMGMNKPADEPAKPLVIIREVPQGWLQLPPPVVEATNP